MFSVQNADESKAVEFRTLVDDCMRDIVKSGLDKAATDAILSATLLGNSNLTEMGNTGIMLSQTVGSMWANSNNTNYMNNLIQNIRNIKTKAKDNYLESLITKYIVNNSYTALVTTIPEAGLAEKQVSSEKKYLSDLKASMSKDEIEKIVSATKSYNEWNNKEQDQKIVEALQVVKVADLPEEVKKYDIKDTLLSDGVRILSTEANVGETEITSLSVDTSSVPIEKLHYLQLYANTY